MLQFIPVQDSSVYAVRVTGRLAHEDYQTFLPELQARFAEHDKLSLLFELDEFRGWDLQALKDDFRFARENQAHFEKIAFVGDKAWQHWMALMAVPFVSGEVRYYQRDEIAHAWDWLREEELTRQAASTEVSAYQRIVAAVDFSPHSVRAVRRAVQIAKSSGACVKLLHVLNEEYLYDILYGPAELGYGRMDVMEDPQETERSLRASANQRMIEMLAEMGESGLAWEVVVGTPASAIVSYAESQKANLLVVGTHGRRGLARLMGSNARSVVAKARCEVLVVPLPTSTQV